MRGAFRWRREGAPNRRSTGPERTVPGDEVLLVDDLEFEVRDHVDADDPPRTNFISFRALAGKGIHCWLNGARSRRAGSMPAGLTPTAPSQDLWSNTTPHDLTAPPWTGWIRSLRIYEEALPDAWIDLAQHAELDPDFVARAAEESIAARRKSLAV